MISELPSPEQVTLERLEDQIQWYDKKSIANQKHYKCIKLFELIFAAIIPFLSSGSVVLQKNISSLSPDILGIIIGLLGVGIIILKGLESLNQSHTNWLSYRATCEILRHEKFLYLAKAAHYAEAPAPQRLLAERLETIISSENNSWVSDQHIVKDNTKISTANN